jgi:hypothetical protein
MSSLKECQPSAVYAAASRAVDDYLARENITHRGLRDHCIDVVAWAIATKGPELTADGTVEGIIIEALQHRLLVTDDRMGA